MTRYRELTLGELSTCKHCDKEITVFDGGIMGYYWCHVTSDKIPCFPIPGVWVRQGAEPDEEDDDDNR